MLTTATRRTAFGHNYKVSSCDTEIWHTIGINYLFNDQVTVGLDYVIKAPEKAKGIGNESDLKYANTNELILITELDLL